MFVQEPEEPGKPKKPEEPAELEEPEEPGEPKKPGELEKLGEFRKLEEDSDWDERPHGKDKRPLPFRMDWSRGFGAEETMYILGRARPPAVTRACTKVPAEREKAAGGVAARETNKRPRKTQPGLRRHGNAGKRKRSWQWSPRERGWPSDHGQTVPPQATPEQQAAKEEGEKKTGQQDRLASIGKQLA